MDKAPSSQGPPKRPGDAQQRDPVAEQASSSAVDDRRPDPVPSREADSISDISHNDRSRHHGGGGGDEVNDNNSHSDGNDEEADDDNLDGGDSNNSSKQGDDGDNDNNSHKSNHNLDSDGEPDYDKLRSEGFLYNSVSDDPDLVSRWHCQDFTGDTLVLNLTDRWWEVLQTYIRKVVFILCPRKISPDMFSHHDAARLSWIAKERAWLRLTTGFPLVFCEAWIWHILCGNLFSQKCKDKWRQGPWSDFGNLIQNLQGNTLTGPFSASSFIRLP